MICFNLQQNDDKRIRKRSKWEHWIVEKLVKVVARRTDVWFHRIYIVEWRKTVAAIAIKCPTDSCDSLCVCAKFHADIVEIVSKAGK